MGYEPHNFSLVRGSGNIFPFLSRSHLPWGLRKTGRFKVKFYKRARVCYGGQEREAGRKFRESEVDVWAGNKTKPMGRLFGMWVGWRAGEGVFGADRLLIGS